MKAICLPPVCHLGAHLQVAGGLPTIRELYKKGDDHQYVERLSKKWLAADWRKKAYDTDISLASLVPENKWSLGALRFLMRWRSYIP